jgi:FMN phosphatase YigB (HAD superfamily)
VGEDRVVITPEKTAESLRGALEGLGVGNPARTVVVGNSLRSDINPALLVGAAAVLVEPYEMWYYDNVPPVHEGFLKFTTFPEAVAHLLGDGASPEKP